MLDISMCYGGNCPKKSNCYRYAVNPTANLKTYFTEPPFNRLQGDEECFWFMPLHEEKSNGPVLS